MSLMSEWNTARGGASPARRLAAWCAAPPPWSAASLEGARRAFTDTIAVTLAGAGEESARRALAAVSGWGAGPAVVAGDGRRLAAPWAALANGTAAHAQDYDDVLVPAMSHPSAALVPAVLALGEEVGASGSACLDAYLVGFEVLSRLGEAMNLAHYHKGWHTTSSLGAIGVAAAAARLLRLDAAGTEGAMSLATSMAGGSKRQFGTMAKPLHAGLAAKNGIVAAQLAAAGLTAVEEPFEGKWGYIELTAGPQAPGFGPALDALGTRPAMEQYGLWLKLYPCCAATHRPVDAVRAAGVRADDVREMIASVSEVAAANLRYRIPETVSQARFSLPYCLAAAVVDRTLGPASFTPDAIRRPQVLALAGRVRVEVDPAQAGTAAVAETEEWACVEIVGPAGPERHKVVTPAGHPGRPLSADDLAAKFMACAGPVLSPGRAGALHGLLGRLDAVGSIREVTAALAPACGAAGGPGTGAHGAAPPEAGATIPSETL